MDVTAFERLLGPCMDIMKRNMEEYEEQLVKVFGSKVKLMFIDFLVQIERFIQNILLSGIYKQITINFRRRYLDFD